MLWSKLLRFRIAVPLCLASLVILLSSPVIAESGQDLYLRQGIQHFNEGNYEQAKSVLFDLAGKKNPTAEYMVGLMYFTGHGVPEDSTVAMNWFRQAAAHGSTDAQKVLSGYTARSGDQSPAHGSAPPPLITQADSERAIATISRPKHQKVGPISPTTKAPNVVQRKVETGSSPILDSRAGIDMPAVVIVFICIIIFIVIANWLGIWSESGKLPVAAPPPALEHQNSQVLANQPKRSFMRSFKKFMEEGTVIGLENDWEYLLPELHRIYAGPHAIIFRDRLCSNLKDCVFQSENLSVAGIKDQCRALVEGGRQETKSNLVNGSIRMLSGIILYCLYLDGPRAENLAVNIFVSFDIIEADIPSELRTFNRVFG